MELTRARITNFRSIDDSGWVDVDDVACLVGKNESGKTNFLQALARTNPPAGISDAFDLTDDFPRRRLSDVEAELKDDDAVWPTAIEVEYRLEDTELDALNKRFGSGTLKLSAQPLVTVSKDYQSHKTWRFGTDEAAAVRHLVAEHGLTGAAGKVKTIRELRELAAAEEAPDEIVEAVAVVDAWGAGGLRHAVMRWLAAHEPLYVYFSDYERMAGEGNVRELIGMRDRRSELDGPDRTFLALLDMAKADLDDLKDGGYNALKARLEAASIKITDQLYEYWRQNQNSEIEVDHDYEQMSGHPPGHTDLVLKVRVRDRRHAMSVPVDQRSNGFVWFFSFLINFSQIRDAFPDRPLVLLLDEPGTALHGLAQQDFLRVIDERLNDHQVLYTTHQPFLVDPSRLDRARPVVDDPDVGTKVTNNPYKIDSDTLFPIQAALGYEIGQTLFVAPNVLLVEGTSDLIYLQLMSRALEAAGGKGLDRRWTITPVGGVDKMDTFVRLFSANQLNTCVLLDVSGNKKARVEKLVSSGDLSAEQVVRLSDFVRGDQADIEDLFDPTFYVQMVQGAGQDSKIPQMALVTKDALTDEDPRIVRKIDALLSTLDQKRLDHLPPARYFESHQDELLDKIPKATSARFGKLFERINGQLTA
ncbi:MAG: AAA family ATPase [Solirubrobacteraceae bacterium]